MHRLASIITAFGFALASALPAAATSVIPLYLEELVDMSTVAFEATCTGNRTELEAATQIVVTYTTFAVHDVLKGPGGSTYVIKQIGGSLPGDGPQFHVHGIPTFTVGQSYVVFMAGVSHVGFSSPIGLGQGRFVITTDGARRKVTNGRDFRDMTARIGAKLPARMKAHLERDDNPVLEMDLDELKQFARERTKAAR